MKNYLLVLSLVFLFQGVTRWFVDTVCNGADGGIDAGIIFLDSAQDKFIKCYDSHVLQPVGGSLIYTDTVDDIDTSKQPPYISNALQAIWYSASYGDVYGYKKLLTKQDEELVFGTASIPGVEATTSPQQYIMRILLALLALLGLMTLSRRKHT